MPGRVVSRGEIRRTLLARPADDVWRATLGWTRTLEPFWLAGIDRPLTAIPDARRARLTAATESAFGRMDDWWHRRTPVVQARRKEIDSSISLLGNAAPRGGAGHLIQAPVARHVARALRGCLHLAAGGYGRDQFAAAVAGLLYDWACCRTLFPGDPAVLLQAVPGAVLDGGEAFFDEHHHLFGEPADRYGLRAEADAVLAEAARIWASFDDPQPWRLPEDIRTRPYARHDPPPRGYADGTPRR